MIVLTDNQNNIQEFSFKVLSDMIFDCICIGMDDGGNQEFNFNNISDFLTDNSLATTKSNKDSLSRYLDKAGWVIRSYQL